MKRILFVHNQLTRFVQIDRDLLADNYAVTERHEAGLRHLCPAKIRRAVAAHDAVFCWFASWHSFLPLRFARRLGKPSIVVVGGYDTANVPEAGYGAQRGGVRRFISRTVIRSATHLIKNSEAARREAISQAGADPCRISVIYHGIDPLPPGPWDGRERVVLTVGNVWRENLLRKGLLPFVRAAAYLPNVSFVHVGRWCDDSIEELRRVASPNVDFLGFLPDRDLFKWYARASVYVQASLHEGFGLSVAEAMTGGCIPVVTRAGALAEVVGDAGVYTESSNPRDLAMAIERALGLGGDARRLARDRILALFPTAHRRRALIDTVERLVDARPRRVWPPEFRS
jgi:glycosyltransferase involved in cell wall biosynthesis